MDAEAHTHTFIPTSICTHIQTVTHTSTNLYTHVHSHMHTQNTFRNKHMHRHIYIHIHIPTYTYSCAHMSLTSTDSFICKTVASTVWVGTSRGMQVSVEVGDVRLLYVWN